MKGTSVLKTFIILFTAVFVIHQFVSSVYTPIKTETAKFHTMSDGYNITGVIIRNETPVKYNGSGVRHFVVKDGNRVSKDGIIANVYDSESASIAVSQTKILEEKIADIEDILSYNDMGAANLDLINSKVRERVNALIFSTSTGDYNSVMADSESLLSAMNRKQAAMGVTEDLANELATLKAQIPQNLTNPKDNIIAECSGYFVSQTDGYEAVLTPEDLSIITPEFLDSVEAEEKSNDIVGKIVSDYEWYIAAKVSINESMNFKEGDNLKINTSVKSSPTLSVKVKKINVSDTSDSAVIIFACNQMNSELASMRNGPMTVVKAEYSGLKVPRKALRVVDSVRGVYVLSGMQVNFVPVEILYSDENYIICEKINEAQNGLKLYDMVVVKGKNLYDGKIVG